MPEKNNGNLSEGKVPMQKCMYKNMKILLIQNTQYSYLLNDFDKIYKYFEGLSVFDM